MANSHGAPEFEAILAEFKKLWKKNQVKLGVATFKDLETSIGNLQSKQHSQRQLRDLNQIERFLKAIDQYGEVVQEFCGRSDILPCIWGPIKLLLQITDEHSKAFNGLLVIYKRVGQSLPLLSQYRELLRAKPDMVRVLFLISGDMLKIHRDSLRYFQQPQWKNLFDETWESYSSRFGEIISSVARHASLLEGHANPEIESESQAPTDYRFESEDSRRFNTVTNWLRPTDVKNDQENFSKIREEYGHTGQWLLDNPSFKRWFDPRYPDIPPLLWLNGIPGAGKTVLASLIIEKAQNLTPKPTVLYFYCKYQNPDRDNFLALARSLLAQFLKQDEGLLLNFYQKCCNSGEALLTSRSLVKELLDLAFSNCRNAYIILDGLDECARDERKLITQWFRNLVEDLPPSEADRFRCLFISQDDGVAQKDFDGMETITIRVGDNADDIHAYSLVEAEKLRKSLERTSELSGEKLELSDEKEKMIAITVASSARGMLGMFLLAKLVWINLASVASIRQLDDELEPDVLPNELNDAYRRILARIDQRSSPATMKNTLMLLGWLVCAKRPLKWHEIQGLKSINLDEQLVDFNRERFVVGPKDLCGSLVEIRSDGTLEFVHLTAKFFLVEEGCIDPAAEEIKLASLCIDYLNLPAFLDPPTERGVLNGDYVFMDYAVLYWIQHLEAGVVRAEGKEQLIDELTESLVNFIEQHWASPGAALEAPKRIHTKLQLFEDLPFYNKLTRTVVSARKHSKYFGLMKKEEIALDLIDIVANAREVLERIFSSSTEVRRELEQKYGKDLFKCPRFSCHFFPLGFCSADERDKHVGRHDRPFRCTNENCPSFVIGFTLATEREKHMKETHSTRIGEDEEFPTPQDVQRSIEKKAPQEQAPAPAEPVESSESEPEPIHQRAPQPKKQRQTEFKCQHCPKVFKKRYNLTSHLAIHRPHDRPHKCPTCGVGFARQSDQRRHTRTKHTDRKTYYCSGVLKNGDPWGCGRSFARADILSNHHKSRVGQACLLPYRREREHEYWQAQYTNGQTTSNSHGH